MCSGVPPSSIIRLASRPYVSIIRLPTKPKHTPTNTATLLIFLAIFIVVLITSGEVLLVLTTSNNFITLAGLKKCKPITSCGRLVASAISSMSRVEVFEAKIAPGLHTASKALKTSCLTDIFSNTASITRSTSLKAAYSVEPVNKAILSSTCSAVSLPFLAEFS